MGEAYAGTQRLDRTAVEVHAVPQPLSPFNWKVIVSHGDGYDVALVNLRRNERRIPPESERGIPEILGMWGRIDAGYEPVSAAHWIRYSRFGKTESQNALARKAWNQEIFAPFRDFAMFPVLDKIESHGSGLCVRFLDLRFTIPSLSPSLGFGVCRDGSTSLWRLRQKDGVFDGLKASMK